MTNREKYKDEIKAAIKEGSLYTFLGKYVPTYDPNEVDIYIMVNFIIWLDEEYTEPEVDWSQVAVDTPILVKDEYDEEWTPRYFAKYEDGLVFSWVSGCTSWSAREYSSLNNMTSWKFAKLAEVKE